MQKPESVLENETQKFPKDFEIKKQLTQSQTED